MLNEVGLHDLKNLDEARIELTDLLDQANHEVDAVVLAEIIADTKGTVINMVCNIEWPELSEDSLRGHLQGYVDLTSNVMFQSWISVVWFDLLEHEVKFYQRINNHFSEEENIFDPILLSLTRHKFAIWWRKGRIAEEKNDLEVSRW